MAPQMSPRGGGAAAAMVCFLLAVILCAHQPAHAKLPVNFQHVHIVEDISTFKALEGLKMLYYFVNIRDSSLEFFYEYDKAANFLSQYTFRSGIVDCSSVTTPSCKTPGIGTKLLLYRNDDIWATLKLENMFDVNSIASNALQIALLDVVDIITTKMERFERMAPLQGEKDIVFGYFSVIGTYVHRVFMEVAYAFNDKVQFMFANSQRILSDLEMPKDGDDNAIIWFFKCKNMPAEDKAIGNCPSIRYRGNITLNSLLWALRLLDGPKHFYLPEDGSRTPCQAVHCIYLYYDEDKKEKMIETADMIVNTYQGVFATVLVNLESKEIADLFGLPGEMPSISLTYAGEEDHYHFRKDPTKENLFEFIEQALSTAPNNTANEIDIEEMGSLESFSIDDEVVYAVYESRHLNIDFSSLTALTDKTFAETEISPNLTLVLFYKPFDPAGVALLQHLNEWVSETAGKFPELSLAYVNCFDWTDVCSQQMILHSPTVRLIGQQHGQDIKALPQRTYVGALNPKDIVSFLFTYRLDGTMEVDANEAHDLLKGNHRHLDNLTSFCLFGLFHEQSQEMEEFKLAAKQQRGKTLFALAKGTEAETFIQTHGMPIPSVSALRWDDPLIPITSSRGPFSKETILEFSEASKLPKFPELQPELLPIIYKTKRPLLILFWKEQDPSYIEIKNVLALGTFNDVIFTWINLTAYSDFGIQLVETYFTVPSLPALSMVYFSENCVYNFMDEYITSELVQAWIERVSSSRDSIEPSYRFKENGWKPQKEHYDFLKDHPFDDWENEKKKNPDVSASMPHQSSPKPGHEEL